MAKIFAADINLSQNQLLNVIIHSGNPEPGSPLEGQFFYNTASHLLKFYNGTIWVTLGNIGNMDAAVAAVEMGDQKITGLSDPTNSTDAANKRYVDSVCEGLDVKTACRLSTTAGGNISLTGLLTIDGVVTVAGDRVLVQNQTSTFQNGIYVVSATAWSRSSDCATWQDLYAAYTTITSGATLAATNYVCTIKPGGTLGVDAVTWTLFSSAALTTITNVGTGLGWVKPKVGNDFPMKSLIVPAAKMLTATANTNDITLDVSAKMEALNDLGSTVGLVVQSGASTWAVRSLASAGDGIAITNPTGGTLNPTVGLSHDVAAIEALTTSGIAVRTGTSTWATRQITSTGSTISVTNPAGTAADINLEVNTADLHDNEKLAKYYQGTFTFALTGQTITVTHNLALVTPFIPNFKIFETATKAQIEVEIVSGTTNAFAFKMTGNGFSLTAGYYSIVLVG
jgi:hypothetical protein